MRGADTYVVPNREDFGFSVAPRHKDILHRIIRHAQT